MTATPIRIVPRKLDDLVRYERNPRVHSPTQIRKLVNSILEFGWGSPLITDGNNGLVAGHGRLDAAIYIRDNDTPPIPNWPDKSTAPTIDMGHLSEAQKRAFIIADNAIADAAEFDQALLGIELQSLHDEGFSLDLTGLDADMMGAAMYPDEPKPAQADAAADEDVRRCPECGQKLRR